MRAGEWRSLFMSTLMRFVRTLGMSDGLADAARVP